MNLFVGRPFQAVVTANKAEFDAMKRASYIFLQPLRGSLNAEELCERVLDEEMKPVPVQSFGISLDCVMS